MSGMWTSLPVKTGTAMALWKWYCFDSSQIGIWKISTSWLSSMTAVDLMSLRLVFKMKPRLARVCLDSSSTSLTVKAYGDVCLFDAEARI